MNASRQITNSFANFMLRAPGKFKSHRQVIDEIREELGQIQDERKNQEDTLNRLNSENKLKRAKVKQLEMAESQLRGAISEVSAQVGKMKTDQESLRKEISIQRQKLNQVQCLSDPALLTSVRRERSSVQAANRALDLTVANLARATGGVQTGVGSARATGGVQTGV
eukprot:358497_1